MTVEQLTEKITQAKAYQQQLMAKAQYELGAIDGQIALMTQMLEELNKAEAEKVTTAPITEHDS
jgi:predicted transcriptional regulator